MAHQLLNTAKKMELILRSGLRSGIDKYTVSFLIYLNNNPYNNNKKISLRIYAFT